MLFSSRFDDEKDPMFFMNVVEAMPDTKFVIVSPYTTRPPSRNPEVLRSLEALLSRPDSNLELRHTPSKADYYRTLAKARVQFNCAIQDWVSWTLIEASMFGCSPVYPRWKDFPRELDNDSRFLYTRRSLVEAVEAIRYLMGTLTVRSCGWVAQRHDQTWAKQLSIMGFNLKED